MIQYSHTPPFAEASLHFLIALVLSDEKPSWGAEPRFEFELGPASALQQASALPSEHAEPRCTLTELRYTHVIFNLSFVYVLGVIF